MAKSDEVSKNATLDSNGGTNFSGTTAPKLYDDKSEIVKSLQGYWQEADNNRKGGLNPRDEKWSQNLDLYWNRWDFSHKAGWQAKEAMPEVPSYVDRFAAAMKEALVATPEGFYSVSDPSDKENDLAQAVKNATDAWLTTVGRNQIGQLLPFSAVFEEQMKLGSVMATSAVTTWKEDVDGGRVAIESVDPRFVWLDHTYRNLYRIRRIELDAHELVGMKGMMDGKENHIFDIEEISRLQGDILDKRRQDAERTGDGQQALNSMRRPVILDEYIATVVGPDGKIIADRALMVLANNQYLIRGPEKNPFWHGKDWLTFAPLVTAPLSVYGRSYMEDFGAVAKTYNDLTNMILDAVHTSALKAYAMVPGMLLNPNQVSEGLSPNKIFMLDDGYRAEDFAKALELGNLNADAVKVWTAIKSELSDAASLNEVGLGQFAPNSRTSATEITETQQSSSAVIRSIAQTVETRWLDPTLDLVWKTGMQHVRENNQTFINAVGEEMWPALISVRKELIRRPITFQARGISNLIARTQQLKTLMGVLQIVASNPALMQLFMQKIDPSKLFNKIFQLSGIDLSKLAMSQRDAMIQQVAAPMQQAQQGAEGQQGTSPPSDAGQNGVNQMVNSLGIGR